MADMRWYRAQWAYSGAAWPEPILADGIIRATVETAAWLNRRSPGILVAFDPDPPKPEPEPVKVSAPEAPAHRAAPEVAPRTADPVARRGPGRPPKNGG
jgi:hypothetical protein